MLLRAFAFIALLVACLLSSPSIAQERLEDRSFRFIRTNGIQLRTVVEGKGPLIIMLHGWPYGWYLWNHQIDPLVKAGYQVAVPDMRGYGGSERPKAIEAYDLIENARDVVGIADALGHKEFIVVGQDWGAATAWYTTLVHPKRVRAVVGMTYPFMRPDRFISSEMPPRPENFKDQFNYIVYFQKVGVAEAEFEADPRRFLRIIYNCFSGGYVGPGCLVRGPKPASGKLLDGLVDPPSLPSWLSEEELDYMAAQYQMSGFYGPVTWYRNFQRNAKLLEPYQKLKIPQPSLFVVGGREHSSSVISEFVKQMQSGEWLTDFRGAVIVKGAGHTLPMERPAEVTKALLDFLKTLNNSR